MNELCVLLKALGLGIVWSRTRAPFSRLRLLQGRQVSRGCNSEIVKTPITDIRLGYRNGEESGSGYCGASDSNSAEVCRTVETDGRNRR